MRLGQGRRDRDGLLRIAPCFRPRGRVLAGEIPNHSPRFGTLGVSQSIIRIELNRLIKVTDSLAKVVEIASLRSQ